MKTNQIFLFFLLSFLLLSACRKDSENLTLISSLPDPVVSLISGSVLGQITDKNNQGIEGVVITTAQGEMTQTDSTGLFFLKNIKLNQNGAFLKAEKEGYFTGSRTFYPQGGSTNYINIQLIEKQVAGTFESISGGQVELSNGAKAAFPLDAVVDNNGQPYTGEVEVAMHWLDPKGPSLYDEMPGDLTGQRANGERNALQTYGMLAVELQGSNGQRLQLGNGKQAELSFPLPANLASQAPEIIPLWYFDEEKGIWMEEGEARLVGNRYVGKVSHFSFWNCDDPYTLINLSGTFLVHTSIPLENFSVRIVLQGNGDIGTGNTNNLGFFCGNVPKDEVLILQLVNECGEVVHGQTIGPFTQDTDLGNIVVTPQGGGSNQFLKVKGSLVDCNKQSITDGMVVVRYGNHSNAIYLDNNNRFKTIINVCGATSDLEIRAASFRNGFSSRTETYPISPIDTLLNVGLLLLCETEPDEYLYVETDSMIGLVPIFNQWPENLDTIRIAGGGPVVHPYDLNNDSLAGIFHVVIPGSSVGDRNRVKEAISPFSYSSGIGNTLKLYTGECQFDCIFDEYVITQNGGIGQPVRGYINATNFSIGVLAGGASYSFKTPLHIKFKAIRKF